MDQINGTIENIVQKITGKNAFHEYEAYRMWPEICGERIASVTSAETVISGVMYICVKNAVWRQELSFLKEEFLLRFREHFSAEIIKDIIFR